MAIIAMCFLWVASQIPVYLFGGCITLIYSDIGGSDTYIWSVIGNLLAIAAVTPFVGAFSDLFGRRWVGAAGMVGITPPWSYRRPMLTLSCRHSLPSA